MAASTIRNIMLEAAPITDKETGEISYALRLPVSLRGASERQDLTFDRATEDGDAIRRLEYADSDDARVEVEVEREVEVPPTGRQRKPRKEIVTEKVTAYLPYGGEIVRGVREGDEFFPIQKEEVEEIEARTKLLTLTINEFVKLGEVPWERAQACYFLAPPKGVGAKALATLRDAMERKGVAGVAKLMPKSRQKLAIVYPRYGGLMVTCLAYSATFRQVVEGAAAISGVEPNPRLVELTEKLIGLTTQPVAVLDEYSDDLIVLKADLMERAKLGTALVSEETAKKDEKELAGESIADDSLLERLEASVEMLRDRPKEKARA